MVEMRRNGQHVGQSLAVQGKQHIDGGFVAFSDRRRRIGTHHALVTEILDDQQTLVEIGLVLFAITLIINTASRFLIWSVSREVKAPAPTNLAAAAAREATTS